MGRNRTLAQRSVDPPELGQEVYVTQHIPYLTALTDTAILLRGGEVMGGLFVEGLPASTGDEADITDLVSAVASIIRQATPELAFYVHRISTAGQLERDGALADGFAGAVAKAWRTHLNAGVLQERRTLISIVVRPPRLASTWTRLIGPSVKAGRETVTRLRERLDVAVQSLETVIGLARPSRARVDDGQWLGALRAIGTGRFVPARPGGSFVPISSLVGTSRVSFFGDTFRVLGTDTETMRHGAMLTVRQYPTSTSPGMLDGLNLPIDLVVTQSFLPIEMIQAQGLVKRTARQMRAADDAAVSLERQLLQAADDLSAGRISFGTHQASVTIFARSAAELDHDVGQVRRAFEAVGATVVREDLALRTGYFAAFPGNADYRTRPAVISSRNFADFTALHGSARGVQRCPWGRPITVFPTMTGDAYAFSFHLPGATDERTVGHTLVVGQTGSGKTVTAAFLISQARRLGTRVIAFDKDRGLEAPIRALGGSYDAVRAGEPAGFNPFATEGADERGAAWLADWLSNLVGGDLSAVQTEALAKAVQANRTAVANLQTMAQFRSQLRSVPDSQDLYRRLGRWDVDGQHGWLFSGDGADALDFGNAVTAFDLTEIFDEPTVRTAWLSYVFRRIERAVEQEAPTLLVLDEAWKLLDDRYFEARLKDWMLTMRKKNVAVVLLTQRVSHVVDSTAGGPILEGVATILLFPSSRVSAAELEPLGLSEGEVAVATSAATGRRLALVKNGEESAVIDVDLSGLGPLLHVLAGGAGAGLWTGWKDDPEFWRHA